MLLALETQSSTNQPTPVDAPKLSPSSTLPHQCAKDVLTIKSSTPLLSSVNAQRNLLTSTLPLESAKDALETQPSTLQEFVAVETTTSSPPSPILASIAHHHTSGMPLITPV